MKEFGLFIDGEWQAAKGGKTAPTINPATEEPWATVAVADREDVRKAVAAAKKRPRQRRVAQQVAAGARRDPAARRDGDLRAPGRARGRRGAGRRRHDAQGHEHGRAGRRPDLHALRPVHLRRRVQGDDPRGVRRDGADPEQEPRRARADRRLRRHHAVELPAHHGGVEDRARDRGRQLRRAQARVASRRSPRSMLAEICTEAGVPAGVVNVITGPGGTAGEELATHPTSTRSRSPARPRSAAASCSSAPAR